MTYSVNIGINSPAQVLNVQLYRSLKELNFTVVIVRFSNNAIEFYN